MAPQDIKEMVSLIVNKVLMFLANFEQSRNKIIWILLGIFTILMFGSFSLILGPDLNWDLQNYHFYGPYAALKDRWIIDHNAAGLQTTTNPTLDILTTYPLLRYGTPIVFSFILGGFHGFNFILLILISLELLREEDFTPGGMRFVFAVLAAALGVTGAVAYSEIGTTCGDLTTAVFNLASLYLVIRLNRKLDFENSALSLVLCGVIIGLSAGLKLINFLYMISFLTALFVVYTKKEIKPLVIAATAALVGVLISHGWWSIKLWQMYENPIFPFFNSIFGSLRYPLENFTDDRYFPTNIVQQLFYPFFFSHKPLTMEDTVNVVDFRFPLAYVCLFLLLLKILFDFTQEKQKQIKLSPHMLFLGMFIIVSYILWQYKFSASRYAITIELLLPLFVFLTILKIVPRYGKFVFIFCAAFLFLTTEAPSWGRAKSFSGHFYEIKYHFTESELISFDNSAIILGHLPLAWIAPALDLKNAIWLGQPFTELDKQIAIEKLKKRKSVYFISKKWPRYLDETQKTLLDYGLSMEQFNSCKQYGIYIICHN